MKQFAIYIRVSTKTQGNSGLGLEAQQETCMRYIEQNNGKCLQVFKDVESGTSRTRQGLFDAINFCKQNECTLVIAKLDRLARDVEFTFKVINTGIDIYFCDMPCVNTMILGVFASVAQYERELISKRTTDALQAKKARGERLGREKGCDISKANEASANARREKARNDENNKFLWSYMNMFKVRNGLNNSSDWDKLTEELNTLNRTTSTGLEFTNIRCRAAYQTLSKIFRS